MDIYKAKETVCNINCLQLQRMYEMYLEMESVEHTDTVFEQFVQEQGKNIWPEHIVITYVDGKAQCTVHTKEDDGDVPFL
ncbi:hypothetical protein [Clostridium tagluense]|uniref:hypothetical protein n=1 Tax=Clostridium tagluense TaxID=360422 RepID=UPI001CF51D88|nr:hypothetical protein [Clostridium tagluense]MCB2296771.1 hypothetical protein [Clostridium tagluense]